MTSLRDLDDQIGIVHPTEPADLAAAARTITWHARDEDEAAMFEDMLGVSA